MNRKNKSGGSAFLKEMRYSYTLILIYHAYTKVQNLRIIDEMLDDLWINLEANWAYPLYCESFLEFLITGINEGVLLFFKDGEVAPVYLKHFKNI